MKHTVVVTPSGEELVLIAKADFDASKRRSMWPPTIARKPPTRVKR